MKKYVLGFAFNERRDFVVLITKNRPFLPAFSLNGLGGEVKPDETPLRAMIREFKEEAGVSTSEFGWQKFGVMSGPGWEVELFRTTLSDVFSVRSITDEAVGVYSVDEPPRETLEDVRGLLHLARVAKWVTVEKE